jgi:hypothetical protein
VRQTCAYWHQYVLIPEMNAQCVIRGRLSFIDQHGEPGKNNTYGSIIYGFNVNVERFVESFQELGECFVHCSKIS